jgi:hypothetical protein
MHFLTLANGHGGLSGSATAVFPKWRWLPAHLFQYFAKESTHKTDTTLSIVIEIPFK